MIIASSISRPQLRALQALWTTVAGREIAELHSEDPREVRLRAVGKIIGREISSFSDLTAGEAARAINALKKSLGQSTLRRRIRDRAAAHAYGTEGRKGSRTATIATADDIAKITSALTRLGWTMERFEAWLRSPSGALGGRDVLRTVGDCNKVWWALKPMLKRAGLWSAA